MSNTEAATRRNLGGRRALITGSNNGLGLAMASGLAAAGADIVLHGLDDPSTVTATVERLRVDHRVSVDYLQADLSTEAGVSTLLDSAGEPIDILVNNAVVRHFAPVDEFPIDAFQRALAVNVTAAFLTVRRLLPGMRARGWGRIVNMTSVYGSRGTVNRIDYVTTKSALLGMTRAVAMETVGQGITCNALCPGSVLTPSIDQRVRELAHASQLERAEAERRFLAGKQPSGRFVDDTHVADLLVFLCGASAGEITGAMLPMDGGWLAG